MSSSASRPASGSGSGGASGGGGMLIRVDPAPSAADAPGHSAHAAASADEEPEASQALLSATGSEPARPLSATPSPSPAPPSGIGASANPAHEGQSVVDAPHHAGAAAAVSGSPPVAGANGGLDDDDEFGPPVTRLESGLGRRQLFAMLRKNWLLKRRNWCSTLCELLAPLFLTALILVGHQLSSDSATTTPPTVYANQSIDLGFLLADQQSLAGLLSLAGVGATAPAPTAAPTSGIGLDGLAISGLISQLVDYRGPMPVPSLDTFIGAHTLLHAYLTAGNDSTLEAVNRLSIADARFNVLVNLGKLSFAPDTPAVRSVVAQLNASHTSFAGAFDRVYPSEQAAVDYALRDFTKDPGFQQRDPYVLRSWAVIVFDELNLESGLVDYKIRMNYSVIPSTKQRSQRFARGFDSSYQRYFLSGYMTLQLSIEQALVEVAGQSGFFAPQLGAANYRNQSQIRSNFGSLMTAPMPVQSTYNNPFFDSSGPFVGLVLCMALLYPVSRLIKVLVEDKESRMKETLKMMGLLNWVFVASYLITYFIIFTLIAILQTILMGGSVMSHSSKPLLFIYFWLFGMSMMSLSFLIATFFSKAKLAGIVGPIVCFALIMPRYAFLTTEDDEELGAKFFLCIFSPTAYAFAMDNYMLYEGAQEGVNSSNAGDEPVSLSAMLAFMFVDGLAYGFLAWFFEQTLPNEYGSHRPLWFLFTRSYWCDSRAPPLDGPQYAQLEAEQSRLDMAADHLDGVGAAGQARSHIEIVDGDRMRSKARLVIAHLHKVFAHGNVFWSWLRGRQHDPGNEVVAVRDLSITLYEDQITCLLGHNGAGKSTVISMLTGLYPPTKGDAWINGYSVTRHMQQIRHNLGVCPQHNVLFDSLTVREHLELLAALKGVPPDRVVQCVKEKIKEVGLEAKTNVYSASLSGGMKRKLSVAMALIGDSKIVFLDEPTSGMDPYSRRSTWELLKRAKRGRVIVLTTHFSQMAHARKQRTATKQIIVDEADLLGDRVAIIAAGQLRACGSSLYLKNQFGIGYILTLVYKMGVAESIARDAQQGGADNENENEQKQQSGPSAAAGAAVVPAARAWTPSQIYSFILDYVPAAKSLSQAGGELSYQLPLSSVPLFATLFDALDRSKVRMGIAAYGVGMTTLEEVFLQVGREEEERKRMAKRNLNEGEGEKIARDVAAAAKAAEAAGAAPVAPALPAAASAAAAAAAPAQLEMAELPRPPIEPSAPPAEQALQQQQLRSGADAGATQVEGQRSGAEGAEVAASAAVVSPSEHTLPLQLDGPDASPSVPVEGQPSPSPESRNDSQPGGAADSSPSSATSAAPLAAPSVASLPAAAAVAPLGMASGPRTRHTAPMHTQVRELIWKRVLCARRDLLGRFFEVILPVIIVAVVLLILTISFNPAGPSMQMSSDLYQGDTWRQPSVAPDAGGAAPAARGMRKQADTDAAAAAAVQRKLHQMATGQTRPHAPTLLAAGESPSVLYYPSSALRDNATAVPSGVDWGLTPVPTGLGPVDSGLLYALGMSNPPRPRSPLSQPFLLQEYPSATDSLNLSLALLDDALNHPGRRVVSYVFNDPVRLVSPISDAQSALLVQTLLVSAGLLPPGFNATFTVPIQLQDVNGVLSLANVTNLVELVFAGANFSNIALPGFALPASAALSPAGELVFSLPQAGGAAPLDFRLNLNDLARNLTARVNGTDTFVFQGLNLTVPAGLVADGVDSLNITQLLATIQDNFANTTVPLINLPVGALLLNTFSNSTSSALASTLLDAVGLGVTVQPVNLLHNTTYWHAIPAFATELFRAKMTLMYDKEAQDLSASSPLESYAAATPPWESRASYVVRNHPLPLTTQSVLQIRAILAVFAALFVLIPFCYLPASFVLYLVKERMSKAKHLQLVSGCSPLSYWASTFLFDMANYAFVCFAVMMVFLAYGNDSFTDGSDPATGFATFLLFFLYGLAVIPLAYALSFLFDNHTAAQVGISAILFVLGFVLTIGSFILSNIDSTKDVNEALKPFYRLSPPFCLGEGMINLATRSLVGLISGRKQAAFDWEIVGRLMVYMSLECVGYLAITLLVEYRALRRVYKLVVRLYQRFVLRQTQANLDGHPVGAANQRPAALVPDAAGGGGANSNGAGTERLFVARTPSESRKASEMAPAAPAAAAGTGSKGSPRSVGQGVVLGAQEEWAKVEEQQSVHAVSDPAAVGGADVADPAAPAAAAASSGSSQPLHALAARPSSRTLAAVALAPADPLSGIVDGEDEDVQYERERVESGRADDNLIVIKHLRKSFGWDGRIPLPCGSSSLQLPFFSPPMVAVKDLSVAVPAGQCFGFLGINGAGKSTTMSMLTGEYEPTSGSAWLNGFDVVTQQEQVRQELGFCPQFDPLLGLLTAREHLVMYGRIRGIAEERLHPLVQNLIVKLGLAPFADNISETYSGGNKRKLSLALALIGEPSVVFLDEPSTGMDPVSRRFMWEVISDLSKSMSVVLTTHSMEECEALCARVAIMVNGRMACLGSLEQLKQKYGKGFSVEINASESSMDDVRQFVSSLFEGAEEQEQHAGRIKYLIPKQRSGGVSLAQIFASIEARKAELKISDYGVSGASLESIFVAIARSQDHAQAEARAKHNDKRERKK